MLPDTDIVPALLLKAIPSIVPPALMLLMLFPLTVPVPPATDTCKTVMLPVPLISLKVLLLTVLPLKQPSIATKPLMVPALTSLMLEKLLLL